ncbi:tyrosine-type recombinase/integrase [Shewanella sp. Isolate11]|uniref:tyrosine-type recombinase/integrase n=1 Tax=Shewanella sp. Isolate11 TaxID=2908530 RepID=UPI001EFE7F71|nr:tyrosine-type recombinase/integrase [Shewanella sp. Isolate11]MCG9697460.1 tyrosine-type recombinase/integrase [Shewanella sp. Isolate11]
MRKRKQEDAWMPKGVYLHNVRGKAVSYITKSGNRTITLCPASSTRAEVWVAYETAVEQSITKYTFNRLSDEYLSSATFYELAPRTQRDRKRELMMFNKVFGEMEPNTIKPHHIRKYMDIRGSASRTQANHELSAASVVFAWGYERGRCKSNPAKGIKKFKAKVRDRYITNTEFNALLLCSEQRLRIASEISYLCAARQSDVLGLKWSQVMDEGVFIQQGKTGKKQIKAWSARLVELINEAKTLNSGNISSIYVINKVGGGRLTNEGLRSSWKRAMKKLAIEHPDIERNFTFHDIKAKGISDFDGTLHDKQQFSGHKTMGQVNVYDRKVPVVPSIGSNNK